MKKLFILILYPLISISASAQNYMIVEKNDDTITEFNVDDIKRVYFKNMSLNDHELPEGLEAIDLGLPSGTKWANMNIGANTPEEFGSYFAWGETEESDYYYWNNYKYCMGSFPNVTKYCTNASYGPIDNLTQLEKNDDAAQVLWSDNWRMPTHEEQLELLDNCTVEWVTQNDVYGLKFTGPNGNSIFLPAAGRKWQGDFLDGNCGFYWSSTLYPDRNYGAKDIQFTSNRIERETVAHRCGGHSIRPVVNSDEGITYPDLSLSSTTLNLMTGYGGSVNITSGSGDYLLTTDDSDVATAQLMTQNNDIVVFISTYKVGHAIITVTDINSKQVAKISVTVTNESKPLSEGEYVDLGLESGTLWGTCNIGANSPEEYGWYVSWGETAEKDVYNRANYSVVSVGNTEDLSPEQDVAYVIKGENWRMPTNDEIIELLNCSWSWEKYNDVLGARVTGPNGNSIFLPAAAYKENASIQRATYYGSYWGSTHGGTSWNTPCAAELIFGVVNPNTGWTSSNFYFGMGTSGFCFCGRSVRPVYTGSINN